MYAYAHAECPAEQRDDLVREHLPQVTWIASRIHERLPPSVELEDLISAGVVGLLAAIDQFDPNRNASLRTYAEYKIRGAILDSIRGLDGIPSHKRKRLRQVQDAIANAEQTLQRTPTQEDIAAELGITGAEYDDWMLELQTVSLATLRTPDDGQEVNAVDFAGTDADDSPAHPLERSELERVITEGIKKMPENERTVLSLYYMEDLNLKEIASVMDLHVTRISQLRAQGMLRLRAYMARKWPSTRGIY